jgi:hypothetical protein
MLNIHTSYQELIAAIDKGDFFVQAAKMLGQKVLPPFSVLA